MIIMKMIYDVVFISGCIRAIEYGIWAFKSEIGLDISRKYRQWEDVNIASFFFIIWTGYLFVIRPMLVMGVVCLKII